MNAPLSGQDLQTIFAVFLAAFGLWIGLRIRTNPGSAPIRLAGVGRLSAVTHTVIALACIGVSYHIIAHAQSWDTLKAPLWIAIIGAVIAVFASIGVDALEGPPTPPTENDPPDSPSTKDRR